MKSENKSKVSTVWLCRIFYLIPVIFMTYVYIESNFSASCACKSKASEAKAYIGVINRAQQALYVEKNFFAKSFDELNQIQELGLSNKTKHYQYIIQASKSAAFNYAVARKESNNQQVPPYASFVSATFISKDNSKILGIICKSNTFGSILLPQPTLQNNVPTCAEGTSSKGIITPIEL